MKHILVLTFLVSCSIHAQKAKIVNIQRAVSDKIITIKVRSKGGFLGNCIKASIHNNKSDSLYVDVEPGRRLDSKNNERQDILIVKQKRIALAPNETKEEDLYGFCCQHDKHAPEKNDIYSINKLADSILVRLARFINVHNFPEHAIQQSVWSISDKGNVAYITADDGRALKDLQEETCKLLKTEVPWYNILAQSTITSTGQIMNDPINLFGYITTSFEKTEELEVRLVDKHGKPLSILQEYTIIEKGDYSLYIDLAVKGFPKGDYTIDFVNRNSEVVFSKPVYL